MSVRVLQGGILTLLVDQGRVGFQHVGITTGGPMDEHAYCWANRLLSNPMCASQLEVTYGLFQCEFTAPTRIALTGADLQAELNGEGVAPWQVISINAGDHLVFKTPKTGLRAYLAIQGGFNVKPQFGSCTSVSRESLGGLYQDGKAIDKKDIIHYDSISGVEKQNWQGMPRSFIPNYHDLLTLDVILGYQFSDFEMAEIKRFFSQEYTVSQHIDRMGYRLSGEALKYKGNACQSEGISYGAIQVPDDGQPIILMRDRQTIGGYPKLGCVSVLDTGKLAQRGPGAKIMFRPVMIAEARHDYRKFKQFFAGT